MPIIKTYEKEEAKGELKELYDQIIQLRGEVGNNAKLFSSSPAILKQQMEFIKYYMSHETLSTEFLAAIRILVSNTQKCKFCIDFNTAMLINMFGWSLEEIEVMKKDIKQAKFDDKEKSLLEFVISSIKDAHSATHDNMESLRNLGWSDKDILDALNHGARMLATDIVFNTFKINDYK
jgi:alkylhydroperoxidase family enzyme